MFVKEKIVVNGNTMYLENIYNCNSVRANDDGLRTHYTMLSDNINFGFVPINIELIL